MKGRFDALSSELGAADRRRLDAHLTYFREVEERSARAAAAASACVLPEAPEALR